MDNKANPSLSLRRLRQVNTTEHTLLESGLLRFEECTLVEAVRCNRGRLRKFLLRQKPAGSISQNGRYYICAFVTKIIIENILEFEMSDQLLRATYQLFATEREYNWQLTILIEALELL